MEVPGSSRRREQREMSTMECTPASPGCIGVLGIPKEVSVRHPIRDELEGSDSDDKFRWRW